MNNDQNMVGSIKADIDADNKTYNYKWSLTAHDIDSGREKLRSPRLTTTIDNFTFEWQIWLYPRIYHLLSNAVAISLYNFTNNVVTAVVSFGVLNLKGEVTKKKVIDRKTYNTKRASATNWKLDKFIERDLIYNDTSELFNNGVLTIECEIKIYEIIKNERPQEENSDGENYFDEDIIRLQQFDKYEDLMSDDSLSDISVTVEGKTLRAHKCILAKSSPVFAAMFRCEMKEKGDIKLAIEDIKYEAVVEMLRFIYAGKINLEFDNISIKSIVSDLLFAAGKYCVSGLKYTCVLLMRENLWIDNVVEIIKLADKFQEQWLKSKALKLIVRHSDELDTIIDFKSLTERPNVLYEICCAIANQKILF